MVRATWMRGFHSALGPTYETGYLRVRHLWAPGEQAKVPLGLDVDAEIGIQEKAPMSRWFLVGGPDSLIGTRSASYLNPNFGVLRIGFPFTATTLFGVAVQCVPRFDQAWLPKDFHKPDQGQRAIGYTVCGHATMCLISFALILIIRS